MTITFTLELVEEQEDLPVASKPSYEELEQRIRDLEEESVKGKQAAEKLRKSEERYSSLIDGASDAILMADIEGNLIEANKKAEKLLGYSKEELLNMNIADIPAQESLSIAISAFQEITQNGSGPAIEGQLLRKDGTVVPIEMTGNIVEYMGKRVAQGIFRDITERKLAEENLQKAHKELELKFEKRSQKLSDTLKRMERKERDLAKYKSDLLKLNKEMIETNSALSALARNIDKNKELFEKKIYETVTVKILPIIKDLKSNGILKRYMADLDVLETNLNSIFAGSNHHHEIINSLTDQEMRVAALIKRDLTNQKMSSLLCISEHTVKSHRRNIRKKLKIRNSNINLASYLKSNMPSVSIDY